MQLKNLEGLARHWSVWKRGYHANTNQLLQNTIKKMKYQVPIDHIQLPNEQMNVKSTTPSLDLI